MKKLLDPAYWGRALSHPLVFVGLIVDLLPVYGVLAWGWSAIPLVMLYWMENIIAGVMTIPRLLIAGRSFVERHSLWAKHRNWPPLRVSRMPGGIAYRVDLQWYDPDDDSS